MSENEFKLYDQLEKDYWWYKARRDILSEFLSHIENRGEKTILEIGCGTGGNLKYLFSDFKKRLGLEINETAIMYAKLKLMDRTRIIKGDANELDMEFESINCVALLDVLYHKNINSVDLILLKINKLLKKDGYLLISDGAFNFLHGTHSETVDSARRFTIKLLTKKLKNSKYRIVKASYWGVLIFFILLIKRVVIEKFFKDKFFNKSTDFTSISIINNLLYLCVSMEKYILRNGKIPVGSSVVILAQKIV